MTPWFAHDHTGRELTPQEQQFVDALSQSLQDEHLTQVDPAETAITAEGQACLICLIPHRWLGGLSLVVWLYQEGHAAICWADVGGLAVSHDSLDLGYWVARYQADALVDSCASLIDGVRKELRRPLVIEVERDDAGATVLLRDDWSRLKCIAKLGKHPSVFLSFIRRKSSPRESEIRLTDSVDPPFKEPSNALEWFEE